MLLLSPFYAYLCKRNTRTDAIKTTMFNQNKQLMKRFLLSLLAVMAIAVSASAQAQPTFTTEKATVAPAEGWESYTDPFPTINDVKVEVYGLDSVIIRNWAGIEGYDICATIQESDTTVTSVYGITDGVSKTYLSGSYYYVVTGNSDTTYPIWAYVYTPYCYVGLGEGGESGYVTLMGYYYNSEDMSSYVWGYYNITWGEDEDDTTGITSPTLRTSAPAATYNLAGQKVCADYKGIVVMNGQKVIRK